MKQSKNQQKIGEPEIDPKESITTKEQDYNHIQVLQNHIQKRISDWGTDGYNKKTTSFMDARAEQSKNWMNIKEVSGLNNFLDTYDEVIQGDINPNEGIIVNI